MFNIYLMNEIEYYLLNYINIIGIFIFYFFLRLGVILMMKSFVLVIVLFLEFDME